MDYLKETEILRVFSPKHIFKQKFPNLNEVIWKKNNTFKEIPVSFDIIVMPSMIQILNAELMALDSIAFSASKDKVILHFFS